MKPGYETWYDGSADYTGNAGVWAPMSADPELGLVFLPVEAPTGDYYGGPRHGANLYANCLVALDVVSGEMRWYYQLIHHDIWDWDNPSAPILADLPNGRKLAVQVTKQNYAYVFDRKTGEPVWPIQERPVPQSDVPGEWTSPTQPFPTKPAPYDRQGLSRDDLIAYTPEISAAVDEAIADYRLSPSLYTPSSLSNARDGTKGTLGVPFSTGGANFEGSGYDPQTGMLYVPSATYIKVFALENDPESSDIDYIDAGTSAPTVFDLLITKPPLGRITAIDLTTGDHVWMIANGDTPQAYKDNPALAGVDLPRTGKPTRAGIVVTKTLLFAGEGWGTVGNIRGDPVFRAHDKQTGEIIAEIELPATQSGPPSTYMINGRQYIVMMVTDGKIAGGDGCTRIAEVGHLMFIQGRYIMRTRNFVANLMVVLVAAGGQTAVAQQDWDTVEMIVHPVAGNVSYIQGSGGNIGLFTGDDGVFLIDDQYAPLTDKIVAAIRTVSAKPIRFLVNTHMHPDHTGGNENFGKMGTMIFGHGQCAQPDGHFRLRAGAATGYIQR